MSAPRLDRPVLLEAAQRSADGAGGFVETWLALGSLWAELQPRGGRATDGPAGGLSQGRYRAVVRAAPVGHGMRPVPGQRLRMGPRIFTIEAVTEMPGDGMYLRCDVIEEVAV